MSFARMDTQQTHQSQVHINGNQVADVRGIPVKLAQNENRTVVVHIMPGQSQTQQPIVQEPVIYDQQPATNPLTMTAQPEEEMPEYEEERPRLHRMQPSYGARKSQYRIKRQEPGCCSGCNTRYGGCCDVGASCDGCNCNGCCDRPRIILRKPSDASSNFTFDTYYRNNRRRNDTKKTSCC